MAFEEHYNFRRGLADALERELIGPSEAEEVIDDPPITQYLSGILYPQGEAEEWREDEMPAVENEMEGDAPDPPVSLANVRYPSSMGMTFSVDSSFVDEIVLEVQAARYSPIENDDGSSQDSGQIYSRRKQSNPRWKRIPLDVRSVRIKTDSPRTCRVPLDEGLAIFYRVRPANQNGSVSVTVVLMNTLRTVPGELRDAKAFFQPTIRARAEDDCAAFVERNPGVPALGDEEIRSYRLLFRHVITFAVGHGCSVEWQADTENAERAREIRTTYSPEHAVRVAESNPKINTDGLTMAALANGSPQEVVQNLKTLCMEYCDWIAAQADTALVALSGGLLETANDHLHSCRQAADRMERGVTLLAQNQRVMEAFQLANRAMLQQRSRTEWLKSNPKDPSGPNLNGEHVWRPFQIAFVLLCLEGIANPESEDRKLADLLWFPTGGGKTEAYLMLIAFTMFYRRLTRENSGGVTALMRYTLRLLTIQQFERSALLICCCEDIRLSRRDLGSKPITVGLWVGGDATPNTRADARRAIDLARRGAPPEMGNPIQVHTCPWCGTRLDANNYFFVTMGDSQCMKVACRTKGCSFKEGLPIFLIDEDVYDYRPTLLVATVDKFASLPWVENRADLFNLGDSGRGRREEPRPELIIQDELHLISGPLGTLSGLYETAIDALCTQDGHPPKVIASTATIRRAQQQTKALFNREVHQFPPSGIDARDSFFAVEAPPERRGDRLYIGLMAPGVAHAVLMIRVYAALLHNAAALNATDTVRDPYWTLVGYFNSLRVLGGATLQVHDDVGEALSRLAQRSGSGKRNTGGLIELCSRTPSFEVSQYLSLMNKALPDTETLDVILATNMISVGVDIDRLGLMVMMGQPQSTSEYIQATSRIGRRFPGLVVAVFNSSRSRDRSHYESFVSYHSALYRQVESTSVTPFSARARDRGLHAVLVAMARMFLPGFRPNKGAGEIASRRQSLDPILASILNRVGSIAPGELSSTKEQLDLILDQWQARAKDPGGLSYNLPSEPAKSLLVAASGESVDKDSPFPTLWSLREVDQSSGLYLI